MLEQKEEGPRQDPLSGTTLADRFHVIERIARGGMGAVYRATQLQLGREIALKVLDLDPDDPEEKRVDSRRRFLREAESAAKLRHPNTIVIHDFGETEDELCFIAMELLHGRTIQSLVEEDGPLDPDRAIHIALQIAGSLSEAHGMGMIHRDVKPGNLILTRRGGERDFVKVLDFGLVKDDADGGVSRSGAMLGTPRYMAPEQVLNAEVSPATDVYCLGATLYFMLSGCPPIEGTSQLVLMVAQLKVEPKTFAEVIPDRVIDPELERVVRKCLRKEPSERYGSMADLAVALGACLSDDAEAPDRSSLPGPVSVGFESLPRASHSDALAETLPESRSRVSEPLSRGERGGSRLMLSLAASLALVAAVGVAWAVLRPPPTEEIATAPGIREPGVHEDPEPEAPIEDPAAQAEPEAPNPPPEQPSQPVVTIHAVHLTTVPPGSRVVRGEADFGDAPIDLPIPEGEQWEVTISHPGYHPRTVTVSADRRELQVRLRRRAGDRPPRNDGPGASERPPPSIGPEPGVRTDNRDPWAESP